MLRSTVRSRDIEGRVMSVEMLTLLGTTALVGLIHTLAGPDHYVPFIVMSKARRWSPCKTAWITFLCGAGHVASSIVLGLIGIAAGISLNWLVAAESNRGEIAAWGLTGFGLVYAVWGLRRAWRNRPHSHSHYHLDGEVHAHAHAHAHDTNHAHPHKRGKKNITPWILFTIFVFGPCEPLIPLLMFPAAASSIRGVLLVAGVFSLVTIATMMTMTMLATFGLTLVHVNRMERYSHALAGAMIFFCGVAIHLGL